MSVFTPKPLYVAAKGLIIQDSKLLLLHKTIENFWDLPGGRMNPGETITETLTRELAEELPSLTDFTIDRLIGTRKKALPLDDGTELFLLYFLIRCSKKFSTITLSPEHDEARFFTPKQILSLPNNFGRFYHALYTHATSPLAPALML